VWHNSPTLGKANNFCKATAGTVQVKSCLLNKTHSRDLGAQYLPQNRYPTGSKPLQDANDRLPSALRKEAYVQPPTLIEEPELQVRNLLAQDTKTKQRKTNGFINILKIPFQPWPLCHSQKLAQALGLAEEPDWEMPLEIVRSLLDHRCPVATITPETRN
jgi:hypothetical protein